jgi:hypothetical protein
MKTETSILDKILKELKAAKKKHPRWPVHIVAQTAIVAGEAGELVKASLNYKYESASEEEKKQMEKEAIQCAAMCIRFLENMN